MPIATLARREPVGGTLERLVLDVDEATSRTHVRHGQYVEVHALDGSTKGTYVLASPPGENAFQLVVKPSPGMADRLVAAMPGARFEISEARGKGFPVAELAGLPLVLAVTGSGVAAVLSTVIERVARGDAGRTYLLYGVRERRDIALAPELAAARDAGVEVAICLSREHADEPGFFRGYVQEVARRHHWHLVGGKVFAAGSAAMIEGMRAAAPSLGLRASDILINY